MQAVQQRLAALSGLAAAWYGRSMYGWLALESQSNVGKRAFAAAECGLCAHYGAAFRTRTRMLAGADPTLLVMVLDGLVEVAPDAVRVRCPLTFKITKRRAMDPEWGPLAAVAELQLVLAGEKLLDDKVDKDGWLSAMASSMLERDILAAGESLVARGFPLEELRLTLRRQGVVEADTNAGLDALAAPTGLALGMIAGWLAELVGRAEMVLPMRELGETLGRLLYMVDALHDLRRDRSNGRFNPLDHALGYLSPRRLAQLEAHVERLVSRHEAAFAGVSLFRHREVLEASLVAGLVAKARAGLVSVKSLPQPLLAT